MLKNIKFETSVFCKDKILKTNLKQIVLVGKSNVGKSSFINALANNKKLAKIGNSPGKTRSINYYNVDNCFYIVDLPGYGYSKMSQAQKKLTNILVDSFINTNKNLSYLFFLIDIRHKPTNDDKLMYDWIISQNIPFTIIANKADKIVNSKIQEHLDVITKTLFSKEQVFPFSSETKLNLDKIEEIIKEIIKENLK